MMSVLCVGVEKEGNEPAIMESRAAVRSMHGEKLQSHRKDV